LEAPKDLLYATVKKERKEGIVVEVTRTTVFGSYLAVLKKSTENSSNTINTSFIERGNLDWRTWDAMLILLEKATGNLRGDGCPASRLTDRYYVFTGIQDRANGHVRSLHSNTAHYCSATVFTALAPDNAMFAGFFAAKKYAQPRQ